MKHEIQKSQAEQRNIKTTEQVGGAFAYSFLLPDFALFVIGITGAFGILLTVFS